MAELLPIPYAQKTPCIKSGYKPALHHNSGQEAAADVSPSESFKWASVEAVESTHPEGAADTIAGLQSRSYFTRSDSPFVPRNPNPRLKDSSSTFVSSHYSIDENTVREYIERKDFQYKENADEFMIRECIFCPKPTYGKADNLYKLYISKKTGAFICHRCGCQGSWFDFKRKQGDLKDDQSIQSVATVASTTSVESSESTESAHAMKEDMTHKLNYSKMKEYVTNLNSPRFSEVLAELTAQTATGRWLTAATLSKYCVGACEKTFLDEDGSPRVEPCVVFPWITLDSDRNAVVHRYKLRSLQKKQHMRIEPVGCTEWSFFGQHTLEGATQVVITEGEFDAMAVYQATGLPAVSLPNGAASLPVKLLPVLEPMKEIVLWMDFDRVGQASAEKFAKKLGQGRTRIVHNCGNQPVKDACDCLRAGLNLRSFIEAATCLPHDQILTFQELKTDIYYDLIHPFELQGVQFASLPFLNRTLKGHRRGELTILTGPTGSGKTTLLAQLSTDLAQQGVPTLWGSFEIANRKLATTMLKQFSDIPLTSDLSHTAYDALASSFAQLPLYFLRFFGSTQLEQILDAMEYAVYAYDVQHIVLDNLQFMMGTAFKGYERFDAQENALHAFRRFTTQQNVHLSLVIHPRKEPEDQPLNISSVFGTAKATQEADNVLIMQNEKAGKKLEVKKNRFDGDLGACYLDFDKARLKFRERETQRESQREAQREGETKGEMELTPVKNPVSKRRQMGKVAHEIIMG